MNNYYESAIDTLNENSELEFLEMSIDTIGLNESINIKEKWNNFVKAIKKFFHDIKEKIMKLINKILKKGKSKEIKAVTNKAKEEIKNIDKPTQALIAQKVANLPGPSNTSDNNSIEQKGGSIEYKNNTVGSIGQKDDNTIGIEQKNIVYKDVKILFLKKDKIEDVIDSEEQGISHVREIADRMSSIMTSTTRMDRMSKRYRNNTIGDDLVNKVHSRTDETITNDDLFDTVKSKFVDENMAKRLADDFEYIDKLEDRQTDVMRQYTPLISKCESNLDKIKPEQFESDEAFRDYNRIVKVLVVNIKRDYRAMAKIISTVVSHKHYIERVAMMICNAARRQNNN